MQPYRHITDIYFDITTSTQANFISLKELCADVLISHGVLSPAICHKLPQQFFNLLMQCAIKYSCKTSISSLLDAWRQEVFSIELPVCVKRWEIFFQENVLLLNCKLWNEKLIVLFIVEYVIDSLTSDRENEFHIRCLDFSSIPVQVSDLYSIHKLLIEKCGMFAQSENDSPMKKKRRCSKARNSLDKFVIKINAILCVHEDLSSLCETISHLKDNNTVLTLQLTGIHVTTPSICVHILRLLNLIEPESLDTFSCCLTFLPGIPQEFELIQKLKNFPNLRTLNFELYVCDPEYNGQIFFELSDLFHQLKNLNHLTITSYASSREIHISEFCTNQSSSKLALKSLLFRGLTLSSDGLKNSSLFPQVLALKTLSLTDCKVDLQSLVCLLTSCTNLLDLCLTGCEFSGGNIDLLFQAFPAMKEVEYLNIRHMDMSSEDLMLKAEYISRMPSLKYLSISPEHDFHDGITCFDFEKRFHDAVEMLWNCPSRNLRFG